MPIYEYVCDDCKKVFSLLQRMSAEPGDAECPHCKSKKVKRQISSFSCGGGSGAGLSSGFSGFGGG